VKGDNIQWCSVFRKLFINPLRKMKMTDYQLFQNVLTELVFFEIVTQLRKHIHSSIFNLANPMLNFVFDGFDLVIHC